MSAFIPPQDLEKKLNLGDVHYRPMRLGGLVIRRPKQVYKGVYDFTVQGGAIGSVNLADAMQGLGKESKPSGLATAMQPLIIPANFIITQVIVDVITAPTSGGSATMALSVVSAGDLLAATAKASLTGLVAGIPVGTAATAIKIASTATVSDAGQTVAGKIVTTTIAVAALTAGKFNVFIEGYLGD